MNNKKISFCIICKEKIKEEIEIQNKKGMIIQVGPFCKKCLENQNKWPKNWETKK